MTSEINKKLSYSSVKCTRKVDLTKFYDDYNMVEPVIDEKKEAEQAKTLKNIMKRRMEEEMARKFGV